MRIIKVLFCNVLIITSYALSAQVAVNNDGSEADSSAMLEVKSTEKGLLPPRMTSAQRNAISSPANGLIIYNTTTGCMNFYLDGGWEEFCSGTGIPNADYSIGTGGSCSSTTVNGNYYESIALDSSNTITLIAAVNTPGSWSITTNMVNGYSFSGSGVFTTTAVGLVILTGTGTPSTAQTDTFTATANNNGGSCTFPVTVYPASTCGAPITDPRDGQIYSTVQIGTQCWMAENINIGTMINSIYDQSNNSFIEKYCYNNNSAYCNEYGGLYQWSEMMQYTTTQGTQGICPDGWHLPTDNEWCILEQEVDPTIVCGNLMWRGTDGGSKMKESGTSHWQAPNIATNSSGFTALPGGYSDTNGDFFQLNTYGYWWSSTETSFMAWNRWLYGNSAQVARHYFSKGVGHSVRCLRD